MLDTWVYAKKSFSYLCVRRLEKGQLELGSYTPTETWKQEAIFLGCLHGKEMVPKFVRNAFLGQKVEKNIFMEKRWFSTS